MFLRSGPLQEPWSQLRHPGIPLLWSLGSDHTRILFLLLPSSSAICLVFTTMVPPLPGSPLMGSVESHVGSGATRPGRRVFKAQEQELSQD